MAPGALPANDLSQEPLFLDPRSVQRVYPLQRQQRWCGYQQMVKCIMYILSSLAGHPFRHQVLSSRDISSRIEESRAATPAEWKSRPTRDVPQWIYRYHEANLLLELPNIYDQTVVISVSLDKHSQQPPCFVTDTYEVLSFPQGETKVNENCSQSVSSLQYSDMNKYCCTKVSESHPKNQESQTV